MLYTLLVGRPPFDTNEVASTLTRVVAGHYVMPEHISGEAKDLLYRLLQKNPKDRISIEDVLKQPFMIKYCGGGATNKSPASYHTTDSGILTMSSGPVHDNSSRPLPLPMLKRSRSEERFNPMPVLKPIYSNVPSDVAHRTGDSLYRGLMQQLDQFQIHGPQKPTATYSASASSSDHVLFGIASPKTSLLQQPAKINVPPFSTDRLHATRHRTKNAVLTLCKSGEVVLEFVKFKPRFREERIVDICRISSDGQSIVMFQPSVHGGAKVSEDGPLEVPATAAQEHFQYETLPQKHWKKYVYAARFVSLVKAKTPKVTYYSARAKCVLMESETDFEMHVYEGSVEKVVASELSPPGSESGGQVKLVDRMGGQEVVTWGCGDPYMQLNASSRSLFGHFVDSVRHCQVIARTLSELQSGSEGKALFPVIIGRRPSTTSASGVSPGVGQRMETRTEGATPRTPQTLQMPSFAMSSVSAPHLMTRQMMMTTTQDHDNDLENQVGRVIVPGVGIASRYSNGNVMVEYHDGSRMCVLAQSGGGGITVTQANGVRTYYTPADELPHLVRERLANMPNVVTQLCAKGNEGMGGTTTGGQQQQQQMRYASTGLLAANTPKPMAAINTYGSASHMRVHHMR